MNPLPITAFYTLLQARGVGARADETLNVGVVLYAPTGDLVAMTEDSARLRSLHPDYAAVQMAGRATGLQAVLRDRAAALTPQQKHEALRLLAVPFVPVGAGPALATLHDEPERTVLELMMWLVATPERTLRAVRQETAKRPTRLVVVAPRGGSR